MITINKLISKNNRIHTENLLELNNSQREVLIFSQNETARNAAALLLCNGIADPEYYFDSKNNFPRSISDQKTYRNILLKNLREAIIFNICTQFPTFIRPLALTCKEFYNFFSESELKNAPEPNYNSNLLEQEYALNASESDSIEEISKPKKVFTIKPQFILESNEEIKEFIAFLKKKSPFCAAINEIHFQIEIEMENIALVHELLISIYENISLFTHFKKLSLWDIFYCDDGTILELPAFTNLEILEFTGCIWNPMKLIYCESLPSLKQIIVHQQNDPDMNETAKALIQNLRNKIPNRIEEPIISEPTISIAMQCDNNEDIENFICLIVENNSKLKDINKIDIIVDIDSNNAETIQFLLDTIKEKISLFPNLKQLTFGSIYKIHYNDVVQLTIPIYPTLEYLNFQEYIFGEINLFDISDNFVLKNVQYDSSLVSNQSSLAAIRNLQRRIASKNRPIIRLHQPSSATHEEIREIQNFKLAVNNANAKEFENCIHEKSSLLSYIKAINLSPDPDFAPTLDTLADLMRQNASLFSGLETINYGETFSIPADQFFNK